MNLQRLCERHEIRIDEEEAQTDEFDDFDSDRGTNMFDQSGSYKETSAYRFVQYNFHKLVFISSE